ncbi:DNA polymerase II complex component [Scheffersomyces amazonensis]|uniref:DNA polymerase II complex component n=1 Tax=Scheffersomyces amazonensis TaxID=1078765 RepID=UPI00315DE70C
MSNDKPLVGLLFCCTGIAPPEKEGIFQKIKALGGSHCADLMSDVNYLIVGDKNTPKYKFCIENRADIKFLLPSAISELYKKWIDGERHLSSNDIASYKFPVFHGLNICISRISLSDSQIHNLFNEKSFRYKYLSQYGSIISNGEELISLINKYGGQATESLRLTNTCIISTELQGRRYSKALEWNKPILHPIYIIDCILRGAPIMPDYYLMSSDGLDSTFEGASRVWKEVIAQSNKVLTGFKPLPTIVHDSNAPKPLKVKKNTQIWNSIMNHTKSLHSTRTKRDTAWDQEDETEEEDDHHHHQHNNDEDEVNGANKLSEYQSKDTLFLGFNFLLVGFNGNQSPQLIKVIENHGGETTNDSYDESISHIILPSSIGSTQSIQMLKILPKDIKTKINNGDIKIVTEWFLERSIFYKSITMDRWGQPLKGLVKATKKFKVCMTGFTGIELLHIEKLINYLGFEFCDSLTNDKELLIININLFKNSLSKNSPSLFKYKYHDVIDCPTYQIPTQNTSSSVSIISSKNKINAAKNWQIPIVSIAYIWEIMELSQNNKENMIMPDILDLKWCIYAPSSMARPHSMLDYVRKMTSMSSSDSQSSKRHRNDSLGNDVKGFDDDDDDHQESEENKENSDSVMRLPSPRKAKKKQKYGRIVGRDSEDSLTNKLLKVGGTSTSSTPNDNNNNMSKRKSSSSEVNVLFIDGDHQEDRPMQNHDVTLDEDLDQSQVGYQQANNEELLKYLEGDPKPQDNNDNNNTLANRRQRNIRKVAKYTR